MFFTISKKFFGTVNDRYIKNFSKLLAKINVLEPEMKNLEDHDFKQKTAILKEKYQAGTSLDDLLPEAFALCREAAYRSLQMRHFDVQLLGGIALHKGMIAEMGTGEGKTLVSTLPSYLNALTGKGVHLVTVNDYLAARDSAWMGKIYEFLGMKVGCIRSGMSDEERIAAYESDITYGTNNEFGFDYLRDNLKLETAAIVQRELHYAIVDEVDSILIDEARTPLIISGPAEDSSLLYQKISQIMPKLIKDHYEIDEKGKSAFFTEAGIDFVEDLLKREGFLGKESSLYDIENMALIHHLNQAVKAWNLFNNNVDYLVKDGQVLIIDEFTGRIMEGRRYSDGLHQALEAKEKVQIQRENQTLASITFQNYFRNYQKLAGMTGTASTEAAEFHAIYDLTVVTIPTNRDTKRINDEDEIYKNLDQKYKAIIEQVRECHERKQPVLVGTVSIEKSELISKLLQKAKIPHNVLNAKYHENEAHIIAQAGRACAVTIATNMAGRGTDIMLGGNPEMMLIDTNLTLIEAKEIVDKEKEQVVAAGGLFVIGTERHESRRIDNQLRGRSGRQGDPGKTRFFLSLEDDLMRIFGSDKIKGFLEKLGFKDDESIHHPWISKALEKAQKRVEAHNFEIRKNLIKFDDVLNEQRKLIYEKRREILKTKSVSGTITDFVKHINEELVARNIPAKSYYENWDLKTLELEIHEIYGKIIQIESYAKQDDITEIEILEKINNETEAILLAKKDSFGLEIYQTLERHIFLMSLDQLWKDHLNLMEHLKTGIGLRAYGQKDPLNEYKQEGFAMFEAMLDNLMKITIQRIIRAEIRSNETEEQLIQKLQPKILPNSKLQPIQKKKQKNKK